MIQRKGFADLGTQYYHIPDTEAEQGPHGGGSGPNPSIEDRLTHALGDRLSNYADRTRLVCLLFCPQTSEVFKKDIAPRLPF